ncbi:hypothetical protein LOD99_14671 [Oopsacas minuta]|uniref:RNase H type-1 domain-containing protein n=1 Tax=Oopsacas minuta TaxID=111878 RepID=A0AAV7KDM3_9METZ|nr:hypothetical protein LOD99_14671 [Oopsacas minuta]
MLSYITDFTEFERGYFWLNCDKPTTLCKIAVCLRSENEDKVLSTRYSKPHEKEHAELTALTYVVEELDTKLRFIPLDNSAVLDVIMRINNSPCARCQDPLIELLLEIKNMIPRVHFRLIMFFSNLYNKSDKGIEQFCDWIMELVENKIVVIVCPLVVYKMVEKPEDFPKSQVHEMVEFGRDCIDNFRELLSDIEDREGSFHVSISHQFFRKDYQVYMRLFSWDDPHFFSIYPKGVSIHLSKLTINPEFYHHKAKPRKGFQTNIAATQSYTIPTETYNKPDQSSAEPSQKSYKKQVQSFKKQKFYKYKKTQSSKVASAAPASAGVYKKDKIASSTARYMPAKKAKYDN